ncbi:MAG: hypothetical protein HY704_03820 [Gemmatimonadetes bacterium]|nr:hypothetical protein [Gemmatimonadota bacterium]
MSLIWFHRLLISTAIVFCVGFAAWEIFAFRQTGSAWLLLFALLFLGAAAALAIYLRNLRRVLGYERDEKAAGGDRTS